MHVFRDDGNLVGIHSPSCIITNTIGYEISQLLGINIRGNWGIFAALNLLNQCKKIHLFTEERGLQCGHLVKQASDRPNIRFEIISITIHSLRTHVIWGPNHGVSVVSLTREEAAQPEITQLGNPLFGDEYIRRLKHTQVLSINNYWDTNLNIPVHDSSRMHIF